MRNRRQDNSHSSHHQVLGNGSVGPHNWLQLAGASMNARGGAGVIIYAPGHPQATPAPWNAWLVYFADHGIKTAFMRQHRVATVPTLWPEDFDMTAPPSDKALEAPKERLIGQERRKELANMMRGLVR